MAKSLGSAETKLPAEFTREATQDMDFHRLPDADGWAPQVGFSWGMPAARSQKSRQAWLTHCYGMVGAGRGGAPDSSIGNEMYVVIGQSPRQLDRNITTVGRVVLGMELLSVLPRGTGPLGFYDLVEQRMPITRIRLAADLPESERMGIEVLRTDTATFDTLVAARRNRRDDWYVNTAGHIDVCNVPLPARPQAGYPEFRLPIFEHAMGDMMARYAWSATLCFTALVWSGGCARSSNWSRSSPSGQDMRARRGESAGMIMSSR